jgi:8-oxo-dGTP diphosphatase
VVVAAAIVQDGRVLAARRTVPPELAGAWEFPGGKVEAAEDDERALLRECREELGVGISVERMIAAGPIRDDLVLRVYLARLADGEPRALQDHDRLCWLGADELDGRRWLPADLPAVEVLRGLLDTATSPRGGRG